MRRKETKLVIEYYYGIPEQLSLLEQERTELEAEYNGLRGTSYDGMPHGLTPGKPTEALAERADEKGIWGRLESVDVRRRVMELDRETIRGCLDSIKGEYKSILIFRYRDEYSWAKISVRTGVPERTVRRRHERAMERLGEALAETPMPDELFRRASRARV